MGFTSLEGEVRLVRAGSAADDEGEVLATGAEVVVEAGDALFFPGEHGDAARNAGDGELVLLLANLYTAGEPPITFVATPEP